MRWHCRPRFGYGQRAARFERCRDTYVARDGDLQLGVTGWGAGQPRVADGELRGRFELHPGERATLAMLAMVDEPLPVPDHEAVQRRLEETCEVWRAWVSRHSYNGPWREAVERSLLAIKLLADGRTGAIAAAGTTSLPEVLGGERNYDYRFGWVRDLCFTLDALIEVGMEELTQASVGWLLSATRHTHPRIDPVYALAGDVVRSQQKLPLAGYRRSGPVHQGNNARSQLQLGGVGDLIETISTYVGDGHVLPPDTGERLADAVDLLTRIWQSEDSGLWELGDRAHYGTSKLGCWVALDRLLDLVKRGQVPPRHVARWRATRAQVHEFIERHLFSSERNSYLFKVGSDELDCGMLLAARRNFGDRERVAGTVAAIRSELTAEGPLLYRYSGMQEEENAFLACSFWMAEALALTGQPDAAADVMDATVALASDLGLYSEEMEPGTRAMRGNFPQALTHLALISAAEKLERSTAGAHVRRPRPAHVPAGRAAHVPTESIH
jgi:GH15 family glucan-1,4-alpha-glucosidase